MAVPHVKIGAQARKVQLDVPGRVRAVDDRENTLCRRAAADLRNWQDEGGGRCDVAHDEDARVLGDALP